MKMTEKRSGPAAPGVRLMEVFVKRELTVYKKQDSMLPLPCSEIDQNVVLT